jgi:hypothetical protein
MTKSVYSIYHTLDGFRLYSAEAAGLLVPLEEGCPLLPSE